MQTKTSTRLVFVLAQKQISKNGIRPCLRPISQGVFKKKTPCKPISSWNAVWIQSSITYLWTEINLTILKMTRTSLKCSLYIVSDEKKDSIIICKHPSYKVFCFRFCLFNVTNLYLAVTLKMLTNNRYHLFKFELIFNTLKRVFGHA